MEQSNEIIKRTTSRDFLNEYYNIHLKEFVSASINLKIWNNFKDMNAIAYSEPTQTIDSAGGIQNSSRNIRIAEAVEREEKRYTSQQKILQAIQELDKVDLEDEIGKELKTKFFRK